MSSTPTRPGAKSEIDEETIKILDERILTIDADEKDSVGREKGREEISTLRKSIKRPVLR